MAALTEITGDFAQAVQLSSKILATRGRIYPATTANTTLVAEMDDGSFVRGETNITASHRRIVELTLDPPNPAPLPETMEAIERANLITVGPGSLYTSLITNLLVEGIPGALANARGLRVFICNLMTQANESLGLTASEHIERIYEHTRAPIFDCALVNTAPFSPETLARYQAEGAAPIAADIERVQALGVRWDALPFPRSLEHFLFPADSSLSYSESSRGPLPAQSRRIRSCARLFFPFGRAFACSPVLLSLAPRHKESPACTRKPPP